MEAMSYDALCQLVSSLRECKKNNIKLSSQQIRLLEEFNTIDVIESKIVFNIGIHKFTTKDNNVIQNQIAQLKRTIQSYVGYHGKHNHVYYANNNASEKILELLNPSVKVITDNEYINSLLK